MKDKKSNTLSSSKPPQNDRISELPDPVLQSILSRLRDTEETARTSILSTRWRYLWTCIPTLDIDCFRGKPEPTPNFDKTIFKKFVSCALLSPNKSNQDCVLHTFRLNCCDYYTLSTVLRWIDTAVTRKVKKLELVFTPRVEDVVFELPHCLVTSDSLEVLRLAGVECPMVLPDAVTFPALRLLELNHVCFFDHALVEVFLRSCPLLEDLRLIECSVRKHRGLCLLISSTKLKTLRLLNLHNSIYAKVSCPKLVCLEYAGLGYRLFIENVVSLKKAVILFVDGGLEEISYDLCNITCKLLSDISHVESLSLNLHFILWIEAARHSIRYFPAPLPNLKTLELTVTIDAFIMNVLLPILRCSPKLESLHLIIRKELLTLESWELDEVEGRSILTRHLKRVKFLEFDGEKQKLDISRVLLEHGNALEEMVFSWCSDAKYHEKSTETMDEVSKFYKASSTVKLISFLKG